MKNNAKLPETKVRYSDQEVLLIEKNFSIKLPEEFVKIMTTKGVLQFSDGTIDPLTSDVQMLTAEEVIKYTKEYRNLGMPKDFLLIGLDESGNGICLDSNETGHILFFDHDLMTSYRIYDSIEEYV